MQVKKIALPLQTSKQLKQKSSMIHEKGILHIRDGDPDTGELLESVRNLEDGEYGYLLFDKEKNKALPNLKYLFGHVLKVISDELPDHPPVDALYRYFEEIYAPIRTCHVQGEIYEYFDLKGEKSIEMNNGIEKIIHHAETEWSIKILERKELSTPGAREPYMDAYASQWESLSRKI